ncbi:hypothetical protein PV702_32750, partial [Streptomyces sp. FL06-04B]|nr:hypothetical protein [Streptomyces sp. FL06-04B]
FVVFWRIFTALVRRKCQLCIRDTSPSHPGELPDTGSRGGEWILGSVAAALVAAGGTVLVATRRARRRTYRPGRSSAR